MVTNQGRKNKIKGKPIISNYYLRPIMKEVTLSVIERIFLLGMFNNKDSKHDMETLRDILDDIKGVSLSEEEKKEINLRDVLDSEGKTESLKWDKSIDKLVKLSDKTVKFILSYIKEKSDKKELGVADAPLLEIESKLK